MTFDLRQILASKRAFRHTLAARDIVEKLALLDELRARTLTLRSAQKTGLDSQTLREESTPYRVDTQSNPS